MQGRLGTSPVSCFSGRPAPSLRRTLPLPTSGTPLRAHPIQAAQQTDQADNKPSGRVAWSARDAFKPRKLKPKRSLGQNFLQREEVLRSITEAAQVQSGDLVLEIGPGTGNLTKHLLGAGAAVTAVEKDDSLFERLQHEFAQEVEDGRLRLIHQDFLALQPDELLQALQHDADPSRAPVTAAGAQGRKVVANLPYNLTKNILRRLLPLGDHISHLYLMLQDEVARRLVAGPDGGLDYRAMNLEVAFYSQPTYLFEVDRTAYFPAPNVDGAVVRFQLRPRRHYPLEADLQFQNLVRLAFSERRKMLKNTLQSQFSVADVAEALTAAGISQDVRPQQLGLQQYVALWQHLPQAM